MKKTIKSNEINGFISAQMKSAKSITVCGELPANVKVNSIRFIGEVEINSSKLENPVLEDFDGVVVQYHKDREASGIATAYFLEGVPTELLYVIQNYVLTEFELECIEVCSCCGG